MYRISLATQSLWDRPLAEAVDVAARLGYDAVEIVCHDPFLPLAELRRLAGSIPQRLRDLRLDVASLTIITDFVTPDNVGESTRFLNAVVDLAQSYGTSLVKMSPGPPVYAKAKPQQWCSAIGHIGRCADYARESGVTLAIETHLGQLSNTADGTLRLIRGITRPNVGVVLDWCNIMVERDDPLRATRLLASHIRLIHAKDGHMTADKSRWDPIGEGSLDYPALFAVLVETDYDGYISVEALLKDSRYDFTNRPTDPERVVAADLAALRRLMGQEGKS